VGGISAAVDRCSVNEPIGILLLLVVFLILGPIPIAAIKIERKKPGESHLKVDVTTKE